MDNKPLVTLEDVQVPFIIKARHVHHGLYAYDKVIYKTASDKVIITCSTHGDFLQSPSNHLAGRGCPKCAKVYRMPSSEFYAAATDVHCSNNYVYKKDAFVNMSTPIIVECPIHKEFKVKPRVHLDGKGCPRCKEASIQLTKAAEFKDKARKLHQNKYDYSNIVYTKSHDKIEIVCPKHGSFWQSPNHHLKGKTCPDCANAKRSMHARNNKLGWSYSAWRTAGEKAKNFNGFRLYVLRCTNEKETFLKVGKTYVGIKSRFDHKKVMPYQYSIIKDIEMPADVISALEDRIKQQVKAYKYMPDIRFDGRHECFTEQALTAILKEIENGCC